MPQQKKIESQFADYETAKMLKELGYKIDREDIFGFYTKEIGKLVPLHKPITGDLTAPLWQQVVEWIWEKHGIYFVFEDSEEKPFGDSVFICIVKKENKEIFDIQQSSNCPIIAKIQGIKQAVKHLHSKK